MTKKDRIKRIEDNLKEGQQRYNEGHLNREQWDRVQKDAQRGIKEINKAKKLGQEAWQNNESHIPSNNKEVNKLVDEMEVGSGAVEIYRAFSKAWHAKQAEKMENAIGLHVCELKVRLNVN